MIGVPSQAFMEPRDRYIQNGRVEIQGSFNIREYERRLQVENG